MSIRVHPWLNLVCLALVIILALSASTTHAEDETNDTDSSTTDTYRSPWTDESETDPLASLSSTRLPGGRLAKPRLSSQGTGHSDDDDGFAAPGGKCGEVTTHKMGNFYSSSDGTVTQRIGNSYYGSDGTVTHRVGNFFYHSDGTTTHRIGNFYYDSNGGVTQRIGNFYFSSGGEPCEVKEE